MKKILFIKLGLISLFLMTGVVQASSEKVFLGGDVYEVYKDDSAVYLKQVDGSFVAIEGADAATFEFIKTEDADFNSLFHFAKDKNRVYAGYKLMPLEIDPSTFQINIVKERYYDEYRYFIYGTIDGKFWVKIPDGLQVLPDVDAQSFEIISTFWLSKRQMSPPEKFFFLDKNICISRLKEVLPKNHRIEMYEDGTCSVLVENENPVKYNHEWMGVFFIDKNSLFGFDTEKGALKKFPSVDRANFKSVFEDVIYKDTNTVYAVKRNQIALKRLKYDAQTVQLKEAKRGLYIRDKNTRWKKINRSIRN